MDPHGFREVLDSLGLSQREAERRPELDERTVRAFALRERESPGPVRGALKPSLELKRYKK
ncbi:MAG TPA: hypothetical protein VK845_03590 [Gemmatimonadales bacterium]|nr:hypothetical protein [Gemmatimonadales bacterium]